MVVRDLSSTPEPVSRKIDTWNVKGWPSILKSFM